jgi:hypothetical protein
MECRHRVLNAILGLLGIAAGGIILIPEPASRRAPRGRIAASASKEEAMRMGRRRPLARAAMLGGAGYMAGKRRQAGQEREAGQEARLESLEQSGGGAPAAPAPSGGGDDMVSKLKELKAMADDGTLSPEEFEAAKQKLIGGSA